MICTPVIIPTLAPYHRPEGVSHTTDALLGCHGRGRDMIVLWAAAHPAHRGRFPGADLSVDWVQSTARRQQDHWPRVAVADPYLTCVY